MKRSFLISFCLFIIPCLLNGQIVNLFQFIQPFPSPYFADWEVDPSLTYLQIDAENPSSFQIIVEVVIVEESMGEIVRAQSIPIILPNGFSSTRIDNTQFLNWESVHYSGAFDENILTTGRLPDGQYNICSYVVLFPDQLLLAENCAIFNIFTPDPPLLIYPTQGLVVHEYSPNFLWNQIQWFGDVNYELTLTEIFENQEPEDAIENNPPHFITVVTNQTNLVYDISAPPMEAGSGYVWRLRVEDADGKAVGGNDGLSNSETFFYKRLPTDSYIEAISPGSTCSGSVGTGGQSHEVTFEWRAEGEFSEYYVFLCENKCGRYGTPTTSTPSTPTTYTTSSPKTTGVQITPNPYSKGKDPPKDPLPTDVTDGYDGHNRGQGDVIFVSQAVPGSNTSVTVDLSEFMEPGAAYTYFICGTELYNRGTTFSDGYCSRYSPVDAETGEQVDDNPCPQIKTCAMRLEEKADPAMNGGLDPTCIGKKSIYRDDFIPLKAIGADYDKLIQNCIPSEDCEETKSKRTIVLTGRVKYTWEITGGEGNFVKLGCLPENVKKDAGDIVIFQPPFVPLLPKQSTNIKTTTVKLSIEDDIKGQPHDTKVDRTITIITKRTKSNPDKYSMEVKAEKVRPPKAPKDKPILGTCKAADPDWDLKNDLKKPAASKPAVKDNDKMAIGQWMILTAADQRDNDKVKLKCVSTKCTSSKDKKDYEDEVQWKWKIKGGRKGGNFIIGLSGKTKETTGRFVLYEAPMEMDDGVNKLDVEIELEVYNPSSIQAPDKKPEKGKVEITVVRPGVKMELTDKTWLPEEKNKVGMRSYLVYKEKGKWKPALAHMCRIHFFELKNVSKERGVCLNAPIRKKADKCRDLLINDEGNHEAFKDRVKSRECKVKKYFKEARTKNPVKEYTIDIHSRDFGSFGLLYSLANINKHNPKSQKSVKPYYQSVPWKISEVKHVGDGRPKKTEYKDNRVTIPRDVDENHIADKGWKSIGNKHNKDPVKNDEDKDAAPTGDGSKGDGLTNYEEYRGFKVAKPKVQHTRTNITKKDLFIWNEGSFDLATFKSATSLQTHEVNKDQLSVSSSIYYINFNDGTAHDIYQGGLRLVNGGYSSKLLGIAKTTTGQPAPPNWVKKVIVYKTSVTRKCTRSNLNLATKLKQVAAHELSHSVNVYHHGEKKNDNSNLVGGPRSGNMSCIMRYDNLGTTREAIGSILCTGGAGTGTNAGGGFGNATTGRGNCKAQVRISGKNTSYPKR